MKKGEWLFFLPVLRYSDSAMYAYAGHCGHPAWNKVAAGYYTPYILQHTVLPRGRSLQLLRIVGFHRSLQVHL